MSIQIYLIDNINLTIEITLEMQNYPYIYIFGYQFNFFLNPSYLGFLLLQSWKTSGY